MSQSGTYGKGGGGGGGTVISVTGNTGGAVGPDGMGNINIVGTGGITVSGDAGTNTETITFTPTTLPLFVAKLDGNITGATGDGTIYKVVWDTVEVNQGGDFDISTSTFTAPVSGNYFFVANVQPNNNVGGDSFNAIMQLVTTLNTFYLYNSNTSAVGVVANQGVVINGSAVAPMNAGDTAYITIASYDVSAGEVGIEGNTSTGFAANYFSGYQVVANGGGSGSGIITLDGDTGAATGSIVTIAGGSGITTSASGSTVTITSTGGGSGITTIDGDTGSVTGSTITIEAGQSSQNCGSTVDFSGSSTTLTMNVTDANGNTVIGNAAGGSISLGGTNNTALGFEALDGNLATGSNNTCIGSGSGSAYSTSESFNICLGYNVSGVSAESSVTRIGQNGLQTSVFIPGIDGVNVGSVVTVVTEASDQLGTAVLTAGSGITITPTANTITIASTGGGTSVAFRASMSGDVSNVTGDNTNYVVVWDTTDYNIGGAFDGVSTFTAPTTGLYQFNISILGANITAANTFAIAYVNTTSERYITNFLNPVPVLASAGNFCFNGSVVANMTAGDTAVAQFQVFFSTLTVGIQGNGSTGSFVNFFSGYKIA